MSDHCQQGCSTLGKSLGAASQQLIRFNGNSSTSEVGGEDQSSLSVVQKKYSTTRWVTLGRALLGPVLLRAVRFILAIWSSNSAFWTLLVLTTEKIDLMVDPRDGHGRRESIQKDK